MGNIDAVFLKLLHMSLTACLLVLAVMLLRLVLKNAPKWSRCMMWAVVALRLVCPFTLESALSLIPRAEQIPVEVTYAGEAATQSGISFADGTATLILPQSLAPNPLGSINPMQVVLYIAALLWLVGMVGMLIYMTVSFLRVKWQVREAVAVEGNILICDHVSSPFILGIIRPKIYLPSGMNEEDVVHVLAHERAHLKRRDHWWKPLGFLILTVHWFNPLVWVAYVLLCRDIELACDEKVIRDMGEEGKKPYSNALINCAVQRRSIAACPLAFGEVGVKGRIKSVLNYKKPIFWVVWLAVAACIALMVCFLTDPKTEDPELEEFLEEQILEHHATRYSDDLICCVDYDLLGTKKSGDKTVFYLCVYYAAYDPETGEKESASHGPEVITAERVDGEYRLAEYWDPQYGSLYAPSIREKFPFYLWGKALDTQSCLERHKEHCQEQLHKHTADGAELERLRKTYPEYFGLNASKGLDVYVWQMAANSYSFALFPHTNSERDMSELIFVPGTRAEEMRLILSTYDVEEDKICVIPWQNPISSYIGDYWIIREGEDVEAKRERYAERMRNILFGNGTVAEETQDYSDPFYIGTQEGETKSFTTYVIDTATADMDGDGIKEKWDLSDGPTSGLYTIRISVSENGRQEYFNILMPSYIVEGFEKTQDGILWLRGKGEEHGPAPRIDISIEDGDIVLTENGNKQVPYWGEQGLDSPYNFG